MIPTLWIATAWAAGPCETVSLGQAASVDPGSVVVLGERPGVATDLRRAKRVVQKLLGRGPVTVAIDAFPADSQNVLYRRTAGLLTDASTLAEIQARPDVQVSLEAYKGLLGLVERDVTLLAVGPTWDDPPQAWTGAAPLTYINVLNEAMGDAPLPVDWEEPTVARLSWYQHRIAQSALGGWDGEGTLVLLTNRTWVQGGFGVPLQVRNGTEAPTQAVLLGDVNASCVPEDRTISTFWDLFR